MQKKGLAKMTTDIDTIMMDNMQTNFKNPATGIGARLRSAREALGYSEKDAAARLHLSPKYIVAMETENFTDSAPATFMRGYLRSYARLLNIPDSEIASVLQQLGVNTPTKIEITSTNLRIPITNQNDTYLRWLTYVIIVVLIALVAVWWASHPRDTEINKTAIQQSVATPATPVAAPVATPNPIVTTKPALPVPANASQLNSAIANTTKVQPAPVATPAPVSQPTIAVPTAQPVAAPPAAIQAPAASASAQPTTAPLAPADQAAAANAVPVPQPSVAPGALLPAGQAPGTLAAPGTPTAQPNPNAPAETTHKHKHGRSDNFMQMDVPEPGLYN